MAKANARWRRVADVPFQTLGDETIVIDPLRRELHLLSETGSRVWHLCALPRTLEDLVAVLGEEYDASAADLRRDVVELLDELHHKSLLVHP